MSKDEPINLLTNAEHLLTNAEKWNIVKHKNSLSHIKMGKLKRVCEMK